MLCDDEGDARGGGSEGAVAAHGSEAGDVRPGKVACSEAGGCSGDMLCDDEGDARGGGGEGAMVAHCSKAGNGAGPNAGPGEGEG